MQLYDALAARQPHANSTGQLRLQPVKEVLERVSGAILSWQFDSIGSDVLGALYDE